MENWRDVSGYEGLYQVSDRGRVRSNKSGCWRVLKPTVTPDGYLRVKLRKGGKEWAQTVHRLVAAAFISNPLNKPEVNHINGIKTDCSAVNLEYVTHEENIRHACAIGLRSREKYRELAITNGKKASRRVMRSDGVEFESITAAALALGLTQAAIWNAANGKRPTAGGFSFKYINKG